jgi:hypothetical protein
MCASASLGLIATKHFGLLDQREEFGAIAARHLRFGRGFSLYRADVVSVLIGLPEQFQQ